MNIEVNDEMIEKILKEQVRNKIDIYLKEDRNAVRDILQAEIRRVVQEQVTPTFIQQESRKISADKIIYGIVNELSDRISNALVDNE